VETVARNGLHRQKDVPRTVGPIFTANHGVIKYQHNFNKVQNNNTFFVTRIRGVQQERQIRQNKRRARPQNTHGVSRRAIYYGRKRRFVCESES
jgi:hypothetical protein